MMRTRIIKPILPVLLLVLCGAKAVSRPSITPTLELGPYTKYQANPTVSYSIKSTYTTSQTIYEIFRFGDQTNPNQQTVTKATHTMEASSVYSGAITIPTKNLLGDNGMSIIVELYQSSGKIIRSNQIILYPIVKEVINPTRYSGTYNCPQTKAKLTNGIVKYIDESYSFTNIDDYFLTDIYYRLPFEQFVFQTSLDEKEFAYSYAELLICGLRDYFPYLTYRNDVASIPLELTFDDGSISLSLKNNLYVEPKKLFISSTAKVGYRITKSFYLPINHAKDLVGSTFAFSIVGVGYNQLTFSWETALLSDAPLIGDCPNSGYCVVGTLNK